MVHRIVVRYKTGEVRRGTTSDFRPNCSSFTLTEALADGSTRDVDVVLEELKAVFFVITLEGDRDYSEKKLQTPSNPVGKRVLVTFKDGESLRGTTLGTNLTRNGFLLFPADTRSNNKRIFVVRSAVSRMEEEE